LPAQASKIRALETLMREWDIDSRRAVFCGDSGNDMELLTSSIRTVLVANSRPDVKALAEELAVEAGTVDRLYIASGGFMGLNGNYSGGMLEGIAHYYPEISGWLGNPAGEQTIGPKS
jgi:hypothetical protein